MTRAMQLLEAPCSCWRRHAMTRAMQLLALLDFLAPNESELGRLTGGLPTDTQEQVRQWRSWRRG